MRYYKNSINEVFAFNNDDIPSDWIHDELTEISEKEADEIVKPTNEEIIANIECQKQLLISESSYIIAPLQDACDLKIATDYELSQLQKWKEYRVMLNRVNTLTDSSISWPEKPS